MFQPSRHLSRRSEKVVVLRESHVVVGGLHVVHKTWMMRGLEFRNWKMPTRWESGVMWEEFS